MPDEEKKEETTEQEAGGGKTYDEKYVKELREENKKRREELSTFKREMDEFKTSLAERDKSLKASLGIKDDKEDPVTVMQSRIDVLTKQVEESNLNIAKEKLFNTFTGEALKAGVNPDLIEDAWRLTDGVTIENVKDVVKGLKEKKPFLFAKGKEDVGGELQPGKSDKAYPAVMVAIATQTKQPVEWIEEKAKEFMAKHKDKYKNVEAAAIARFGKPTIVEYKSLRTP